MALASAVELWRQTTSTRCASDGATRLSSICSTISAPMGGSGSSRFFGVVFLVELRPLQRQHGDHLRVRLVDVFLHGVFHLRGQVAGVARVPHRIARGHHRRGQLAQQPNGVRPLVEHVLAADGLDRAAGSPCGWPRSRGRTRSAAGPRWRSCRPSRSDRATAWTMRVKSSSRAQRTWRSEKWRSWWLLRKSAGQLAHLQQEPQVALLHVAARPRAAGRSPPGRPFPGRSAAGRAPAGNRWDWRPRLHRRSPSAAAPACPSPAAGGPCRAAGRGASGPPRRRGGWSAEG